MNKTSTYLVDPDRLCREGLAKLLEQSAFEVTFLGGSVDEAMREMELGPKPELFVVGFCAGDPDEVRAVAKLRQRAGGARIVVLSNEQNARMLTGFLQAGVDAFLLKDMSAEALRRALSLVLTGEKVMPTRLATMLISGKVDVNEVSGRGRNKHGLSAREIQILRCLVNGDPNKEIARRLSITESTVRVHLKRIFKKIDASNRTQAAIWSIKNGLLDDATALPIQMPEPDEVETGIREVA